MALWRISRMWRGDRMKLSEMEELLKDLAPVMREFVSTSIDKAVDGIRSEIKLRNEQYNARLTALEAGQKSLADEYQGGWRKSRTYQRGALVTHKGSLWLADCDSSKEPSTSGDFKLVSKGGQPPRAV